MEINLIKYTNLIKKHEKTFLLRRDEMKYKDKQKGNEKVFHIDTIENNSKEGTNNIEIITNNKILYLMSKSDINISKFRTFLNLSKFVYSNFLFHYDFENEERFKFNTNEYIINLRQYAKLDIFMEILNNILKKKKDVGFILEILHSKFVNFLKDDIFNSSEEITKLISEMNTEFNNDCLNKYNEKIKEFENPNLIEVLNKNTYNNENSSTEAQSQDIIINNIEKINEWYLNLCRIFLELRKAILEIKVHKEPNISTGDIINRHLFKFIRKEEKNNTIHIKIKKETKKTEELIEMEKILKIDNIKEKEELKIFLSDRTFQIFFCFKCGNLMKRTEKTASTCSFDSNCKYFSYFLCMNCNINFCTTCILDVKHGRCAKGHLIFKYDGIFTKNCLLCDIQINSDGYSCNLCDISICLICYDKYETIGPLKCTTCKFELQWLRCIYEKCRKCSKFSECFWRCFFCDYYFCLKCFHAPPGFCGQLHCLETSYEKTKNTNNLNFKTYTSNLSIISCSYCNTALPSQYKCCKRCNFLLCSKCKENKY